MANNKCLFMITLQMLCIGNLTFSQMGESSKPQPGQVTRLQCEFNKSTKYPKWAFNAYGKEHPKFSKQKTFHYDVYLPENYEEDGSTHYPCLFISSPGGNAKLGRHKTYVSDNNWIAVMLVESKNKSPDWLYNFIAAHDDAVSRFRIQEGMKYATGFSGGARCAATQVGVRPGFAGLLLQGAGFNYGDDSGYIYNAIEENENIAVCVLMGKNDSNKSELADLSRNVHKNKNPYKIINFDGGHKWASANVLEEAFDWFESQLFLTTKEKEVVVKMFQPTLDATRKLDVGLEKYTRLKMLQEAIQKHNLSGEPGIRDEAGKIQSELTELEYHPIVSKEKKASEAYKDVLEDEQELREKRTQGKLDNKRFSRYLEKILDEYKDLQKDYVDTSLKDKIDSKITELAKELAKSSQ